jgi:hypothetical protein
MFARFRKSRSYTRPAEMTDTNGIGLQVSGCTDGVAAPHRARLRGRRAAQKKLRLKIRADYVRFLYSYSESPTSKYCPQRIEFAWRVTQVFRGGNYCVGGLVECTRR